MENYIHYIHKNTITKRILHAYTHSCTVWLGSEGLSTLALKHTFSKLSKEASWTDYRSKAG